MPCIILLCKKGSALKKEINTGIKEEGIQTRVSIIKQTTGVVFITNIIGEKKYAIGLYLSVKIDVKNATQIAKKNPDKALSAVNENFIQVLGALNSSHILKNTL
jgi:hypothetical protein